MREKGGHANGEERRPNREIERERTTLTSFGEFATVSPGALSTPTANALLAFILCIKLNRKP